MKHMIRYISSAYNPKIQKFNKNLIGLQQLSSHYSKYEMIAVESNRLYLLGISLLT